MNGKYLLLFGSSTNLNSYNVTLGKQDLLLDLLDAHLFFIYIFNIIPYAFIPRLQVVPNFSQAIVEGIKYRKLSLISPAWAYTTS